MNDHDPPWNFSRNHALNPCLHCAIGELVFFRYGHQVPEDAFTVAKCMVESLADLCASYEGERRQQIVTHARRLFDSMLDDVARNRWKGDVHAGPDQNTRN